MDEVQQIQELRALLTLDGKETDNTFRFEELEQPGVVLVTKKLYVQKKALARIGNPGLIEVIVRAGKA